jgi:hypothetical protein
MLYSNSNGAIISLVFKYNSKVRWKLPDSGWNGNITVITTLKEKVVSDT